MTKAGDARAAGSNKCRRPSSVLRGEGRVLRLLAAANQNATLFLATLGAFIVFATASSLYVRTESSIDEARAALLESYLLADELRQTSDDLTRFVRTYVATGDHRYKSQYDEVLDIREGRAPRPLEPHNVYWDLVLEDGVRPRPAGRAVPLLDLMRQAGFTDVEFAKLTEAKAASDALTRTEYAAMALIESGKPTPEASRAQAVRLLNDSEYHHTKARIMQPIADLHAMVSKRTLQTVRAAEQRGRHMQAVLLLSSLALAFFLWRLLRILNTEQRTREDTDARYRTVFENAGVGLAEVDDTGHVLNINREFCRILGDAKKQLLSREFDLRRIIPLEGRPGSDVPATTPNPHTSEHVRSDGSHIWIDSHTHRVERPDKGARTFIAAAIDVTAAKRIEAELATHRKNLEDLVRDRTQRLTRRNDQLTREIDARERAVAALHESEERFRFIAENTWDPIFVLDVETEAFTYVSSSVYRQRGYTAEEVMSRPVWAALMPNSAAVVRRMLAETKAAWERGERPEILRLSDVEQPHRNGHIIQTEVVATLHSDAAGNLVSLLGVTRDITERKRTEEAIRRLAFYDNLTRLPNRRLLVDRLERAVARARRENTREALLFLDLDGFKPVNDLYGHEVGDWLLQGAAGRIVGCLREADTAARWGGDEFVVLLSNVQDANAAVVVASRIREVLAAPFITEDGQRIEVSSSIGIACFPDDASNESELMRLADQAMYRAKSSGRNTIHVRSERVPPSSVESLSPVDHSLVRIVWRPAFASGNTMIDREHRDLIASGSRLLDMALRPGSNLRALREAFEGLYAQIVAHFEHEETLLQDLSYSQLERHQGQHAKLLQQASQLRTRYQSAPVAPADLIEFFAVHMIREHLLQDDALFFPLLARSPDGEHGAISECVPTRGGRSASRTAPAS